MRAIQEGSKLKSETGRLVVRRPERESHFCGLTWQVGQCLFHGFGGVMFSKFSRWGGVMFSKFSRGGHFPFSLNCSPNQVMGVTSHPQSLCTASCLQLFHGLKCLLSVHELVLVRDEWHAAVPIQSHLHLRFVQVCVQIYSNPKMYFVEPANPRDHRSLEVFITHTFGNNLQGIFALFLLKIFCELFVCACFDDLLFLTF